MSESVRPSVLHFATTGAVAGTEQAVLDLAEAHDRARWRVAFATLFPAGEMNERIRDNGAPCYALGLRRGSETPLAVLSLAGLLRRLHVDVLHCHLFHASLVGLAAARLLGKDRPRLVLTRHYSDELYRFGTPLKAKTDAYIARQQDRVCVISEAVRELLITREGVAPDRIRLTYPGTHLPRLRARQTDPTGLLLREELGVRPDQPLIGIIAHLLAKKGHAYLLRALPAVLTRFPDAKLVLVGRGPERAALELLAQDLGLSSSVVFLGYRSDIPNVIAALDIVMLASLEEGFGLAMVEAMAFDKPIIATRVGGVPEVVADAVTGLLVPPGDSDALTDALIALLADPARRAALGEAGRLRAEEKFTIARLAKDYEAVWTEVLAEAKSSTHPSSSKEQTGSNNAIDYRLFE